MSGGDAAILSACVRGEPIVGTPHPVAGYYYAAGGEAVPADTLRRLTHTALVAPEPLLGKTLGDPVRFYITEDGKARLAGFLQAHPRRRNGG